MIDGGRVCYVYDRSSSYYSSFFIRRGEDLWVPRVIGSMKNEGISGHKFSATDYIRLKDNFFTELRASRI